MGSEALRLTARSFKKSCLAALERKARSGHDLDSNRDSGGSDSKQPQVHGAEVTFAWRRASYAFLHKSEFPASSGDAILIFSVDHRGR